MRQGSKGATEGELLSRLQLWVTGVPSPWGPPRYGCNMPQSCPLYSESKEAGVLMRQFPICHWVRGAPTGSHSLALWPALPVSFSSQDEALGPASQVFSVKSAHQEDRGSALAASATGAFYKLAQR